MSLVDASNMKEGRRRLTWKPPHGPRHHIALPCILPPNIQQAIPKGFDNWQPGERRQAIQTPLHSIEYSTFEGVSPPYGTTLIADFGTYSIKVSNAARKKGKRRMRDTPDTDEEEGREKKSSVHHKEGGDVDAEEEEALAEGFRRQSFIIELQGIRYTIRFTIRHFQTTAMARG